MDKVLIRIWLLGECFPKKSIQRVWLTTDLLRILESRLRRSDFKSLRSSDRAWGVRHCCSQCALRTHCIATRVTPPQCCALLPHRPAEERSLARPWAAVAPSIFASVCTHSLRMVCTSSDAFLHWAMKGRIVKKWNSGKGMYNSRGPFLRHPDRTNFGRSLIGVLHMSIV